MTYSLKLLKVRIVRSVLSYGKSVVIKTQHPKSHFGVYFWSSGVEKDDSKIIERISQNILRLLGMTPAKAGLAQEKAEAFLL